MKNPEQSRLCKAFNNGFILYFSNALFQVLLFGPIIRWLTQKTVRLVNLQPNKDLAYVNELLAAGQLEPAIDGPYPLSDVPRLIQYFGAGQYQGKVVIAHES